MIYNERQYKITTKKLQEFRAALDTLDVTGAPEWLAVAQRAALKSQISDLEAELVEYNLIKRGELNHFDDTDLSSLPNALVAARIAAGMSQQQLAEQLDMSAQQIQRYEATNYLGASLARLIEVARVLHVRVRESWGPGRHSSGDAIFLWEGEMSIDWLKFPFKEMVKRNWLPIENNQSPAKAIQSYFHKNAGSEFATVLHRKKFHGSNTPNSFSLLAWQARILEKANRLIEEQRLSEFELNDQWLGELISLSTRANAPELVKTFLARKGIALIIEPHLPGTYLDGAAMRSTSGHPVIGLTVRHDRLDNFWFVLLHELGHVFLHLFDSLNMDFFDEESGEESDQLEVEADRYALEALISDEKWDLCLSRFAMTEKSVVLDAERLRVHPSIIAGRIRKERNRFNMLADLVGNGEVRKFFPAEY